MCSESYQWHHDYVRLAWDAGFCFNVLKAQLSFDLNVLGNVYHLLTMEIRNIGDGLGIKISNLDPSAFGDFS